MTINDMQYIVKIAEHGHSGPIRPYRRGRAAVRSSGSSLAVSRRRSEYSSQQLFHLVKIQGFC